jgi:hypothetical protein
MPIGGFTHRFSEHEPKKQKKSQPVHGSNSVSRAVRSSSDFRYAKKTAEIPYMPLPFIDPSPIDN